MGDYLNNENKTNLLFKKFQGVIQSQVVTTPGTGTSFTQENKKSLNNVFQQDIFSENVPTDLSDTLLQMWDSFNAPGIDISASSWNSDVTNQTLGFKDLLDSSGNPLPLRFYKRVYLTNASTTGQAWWLIDPTSNLAQTTNNNLLKDTIPYLYNDLDPNTYTPIVERYDTSSANWVTLTQATSTGANWSMDPASGILQFYQTPSKLATLNIDPNAATTVEKKRPRISFIKYVGAKGAAGSNSGGGNGGVAGSFKVGDFSGTDISFQDVSAILFNSAKFDVSYVNGNAQIDSLNDIGNSLTDLSYYFFDKPNAPFGGDGSLNNTIGTGTIICNWQNPPNVKSALPFGLAQQYPENSTIPGFHPIDRLPFFKELCIQYKEYYLGISGDWVDLSVNVHNALGNRIIPSTVNELWATSGGNPGTTDLCGNGTGGSAPYYRVFTDQLELSKGYQFRIFLKNDSEETGLIDPVYGGDASYNYLYIPPNPGDYIELGDFGPPIDPFVGDISFINTSFLEFDIKGENTDPSGADASLNTPFPINPVLSLRVFYGFDISCVIDPSSIQAYTAYNVPQFYQYVDLPDASGTQNNNFTIEGNWETNVGGLVSDLSWAPQHKYTITRFFTRNNTLDFSYIKADVSNVVPVNYSTPIPSRSDINTTTTLMPANSIELTESDALVNPPAVTVDVSFGSAYPYPDGSNIIIHDIPFLNSNTETVGFNLPKSTDFMLTDTSNISAPLIGTDVSGKNLCYLRYDISNAPTSGTSATVDYDVSTNFATGSINVSGQGFNGFNVSAMQIQSITGDQIFSGTTKYQDARPQFNSPSTVSGEYHESGGYYLNAIQDSSLVEQQLINLKLNVLPDICNNNYQPYISRVRQYYNDGSGVFIENPNQRLATFNMAKKDPRQITYTLLPLQTRNPTVNLNNYLMGIPRPNTGSLVTDASYAYNLLNIHNDWRTQLNISQDKLIYRPNNSSPANFEMDSRNNPWDTREQKNIITTSSSDFPNFNLQTLAQPSNSSNRRYSRDFNTSPQFQIKTTYYNNPTIQPLTSSDSYDISFGQIGTGKDLWWDFTWEGQSQNTGLTAPNLPTKSNGDLFFTSDVPSVNGTFKHVNAIPYNSPNTVFDTTPYAHNINLTSATHGNYQLVWANYGFRGNNTSGKNDPYINYSTTYYDSGSVMPNYNSLKDASGNISETYNGPSKQWWNDPTGGQFSITRNVKYITFNVQHPYTQDIPQFPGSSSSTNNGFQIVLGGNLTHDTSKTSNPNGYWLYHKELSAGGTISNMYDGQGRRSGGTNGSWNAATSTSPDAFVINTSSAVSPAAGGATTLQITIGVPNSLSISNAVIESIQIIFLKW